MSEREFYKIVVDGKPCTFPRVTTVLGVINKPTLLFWSAWVERRAVLDAMLDVVTRPGSPSSGPELYEAVEHELPRSRAFIRAKDEAADIGTEAHTLIQWHTRRMLGLDVEVEPAVSDPAMRCVLAWIEWTEAVSFKPLHAERVVWCARCCVAGTTDVVASVEGRATLVEYKTGKALYPENFIQASFYRHLLSMSARIEVERATVIRLPKYADHPKLEAVPVPDIPLHELQSVLVTWRLMRRLNDEAAGDLPTSLMCVTP